MRQAKVGSGWQKLFEYLGREKLVEYSANKTWFFHSDHLGTPRVRTNLSGGVEETWDSYPFGEAWGATVTPDQHRYTGHLRDSESENDYAGARYYASLHARWLSVDPVRGSAANPQSLNRYSYVLNDPVNYIDPDGREPFPIGLHTYIEVPWLSGGGGLLPGTGGSRPSGPGSETAMEIVTEAESTAWGGTPDVKERFGGTFDCLRSAADMQRWLKQNFTSVAGHVAQVPPAWIGIKFEQVPITDGAVIGIHVWGWFPGPPVHPAAPVLTNGISFSVKVEETDSGWIFHTAEDHFLHGTISFSVEQLASGQISFQIGLEGNHANRIHEQLFQWFGRRMEELTWNRLTGIVREKCSRPQ